MIHNLFLQAGQRHDAYIITIRKRVVGLGRTLPKHLKEFGAHLIKPSVVTSPNSGQRRMNAASVMVKPGIAFFVRHPEIARLLSKRFGVSGPNAIFMP